MKNKFSKSEEWERAHFNKIAKEYESKYGYFDEFTKYKINKKVERFVNSIKENILNTKKSIKVFEVGCGTATYTYAYAKKYPKLEVVASDISEEMIALSKSNNKQKNVKFIVKSAYNTGLKKDSVDVVSGFYILHHIDQKKVKKEILRILKPGGMVYFYEPNILNPIVFLIKSNKVIKKFVGDSSEEWAINPLNVSGDWKEFSVVYNRTSEFVWPVTFLPYKFKLFLDKVSSFVFGSIPLLNLIGGSVEICLIKK